MRKRNTTDHKILSLIESNNDLTDLISSHAVGDTLNVQLSRDRQLMNVQVTLGERTEG